MDSSMAAAFQVGSGVNPGLMKAMLQLIAMGVILTIFAWVIYQLFTAYQADRATVPEMVMGSIKATVIFCLLATVVFW
jgi:integrating conjugative element protein (TIGR03758 family)